MNKLNSFFIILGIILANHFSVFAQQDSIKKLPSMHKQRNNNIDIKHIALNLRFNWQKKQAIGIATITLSPTIASNQIALDAGMLTINSIVLQNGTALKYKYDESDKDNALNITLDRIYNANEEVTIVIDYHTNEVNEIDPNNLSGSNGKGLRFSQPTSNDPIKPKEIWSIGEPHSNHYWFPCYDAPNDLRTTEFIATVDKQLTVISNGNLVETIVNTDGTCTFHYITDIPYANHLTSFVVGEFIDVQQEYDGIQLHNYGYKNEKKWIEASTVRLPDMMKFFSESIGLKFPYQRYSQVFVQDIGSFTANNTVSTITENMIDDYSTHADFYYLWDMTEAEALAQQWFGNYLSCTDWSDAWINKSFAHYLNGIYNEHKNGKEEFLLWQHNFDQGTYLNDWSAGISHPIVTKNYENAETFVADNYATVRGSLVLHMLRKHLGDVIWWKAIHYFVIDNKNKSVTTADFQKAVEKASGESMDWFFDQWIFKMGHPVFEVTKQYDAAKKQLTLFVKQTQKIDTTSAYPQTIFFKGKLDIEIDGKIETVFVEDTVENTFTFSLAHAPKFINFDYENTWIKELVFTKSFDEYVEEFQYSKDILARQAAMMELVTIVKSEDATTEQRAKIETILRNTILSNAYWRLRLGAVSQLQNLISPMQPNDSTIAVLLSVIKNEKSWLKAGAIRFLGTTKNPKFTEIYLQALHDYSDRVISAAAVALGKTKSPLAFNALAKLVSKPSMKSQSVLSALAGLKELGDKRGYKIAYNALADLKLPRWRLPTPPVWDFRITAAETIVSLGKASAVYPMIMSRFNQSMKENDLNGIFNNLLLISILGDKRGQAAFDLLKVKFKNDENTMTAINQFEAQFRNAIKK